MNKKLNTVLFILCATLFNIMTTLLGFIILLVIYMKFMAPVMPESSRSWSFALIFVASIVISFFVYRGLFKYLQKKVDIDKYFDPFLLGRGKGAAKKLD